jgi:hypothetical protein
LLDHQRKKLGQGSSHSCWAQPTDTNTLMKRDKNYVVIIAFTLLFTALTIALTYGLDLNGAESSFDPVNRPAAISLSTNEFPGCRYGVTFGSTVDRSSQVEWLDDLGAGWYSSFSTEAGGEAPNGSEFVPLIAVQQHRRDGDYLPSFNIIPPLTEAGLGSLIDARPGALWIVGNEVDRGPQPGSIDQKGTFPDIYAQAYHQVYHFIKDRDPTAMVANSGLVEITPGRIQYLDLMWSSYLDRYHEPMPVDIWNMHIYILPEVNPQGLPNGIASVAMGTDPALGKKESYDPDGTGPLLPRDTCDFEDVYCYAEHDETDEFAQQVEAMRSWMAKNGQRNKPLILSEFSLLYPNELDGDSCWLQDEFGECFTQARVLEYMDGTLTYLTSARDTSIGYPLDGNRLVQQWLWFSIVNTPTVGYISDLVVYDDRSNKLTGLSVIGARYKTWAVAEPVIPNLLPDQPDPSVAFTVEPGGTAEAILQVNVGNNGNIDVTEPFSVTFYADSNLTEVIGSASVPLLGTNDPGFSVPGCARRTTMAQTTWQGLYPGLHPYWAVVDSESHISESNENDNVIRGFVIVNPQQTFFPIMLR